MLMFTILHYNVYNFNVTYFTMKFTSKDPDSESFRLRLTLKQMDIHCQI